MNMAAKTMSFRPQGEIFLPRKYHEATWLKISPSGRNDILGINLPLCKRGT